MANPFFNNDLVDGEVYSASDVEEIETGFNLVEDEFAKKASIENGFVDRTDSTISFVDGTRTFTIEPVTTDFVFYSGGNKYTKTESEDIIIDDTEGLWFLYYDSSGVLQKTQSFNSDLIHDAALVSFVYWDATNNVSVTLAEERHGMIMDSMTHQYLHDTEGTRYASGLQPVDITSDGNGNNAIDAQIGVQSGIIWDEDIQISIAADNRPTNIPILYRSGASGDWRKIAATDYIVTTTGTGRAAYNEWTGATWQLTEVTNSDFLIMHLYAISDINDGFFFIVGQDDYLTGPAAKEGALNELLNLELDGLPIVEYKPIASFIIQTNDSYTNAVQSRVVDTDNSGTQYIDWRFINVGLALNVSGAVSTTWGDINGILSDQTDLQEALDAAGGGDSIEQGLHSLWISASAMIPTATNGAAYVEYELETNDVMMATFNFDPWTSESVQFQIRMPKSWDEGTILFSASWSHPADDTNFGVVWSLAANALSSDDPIDAAVGTEIDLEDTGGTTDDMYISDRSSAVTIAGTPSPEDVITFKVRRDIAHASDNLSNDIRLHGITLYYTIDAGDDT